MEYFILSEEDCLENRLDLFPLTKVFDIKTLKDDTGTVDEKPCVVQVSGKKNTIYYDFIERPLPLASQPLKDILSKYQDTALIKPVVFVDIKLERQKTYWLMTPDSIDCLSEKSKFNFNGTINHLVLNTRKIDDIKIFKINGIVEKLIVVSLDVAESILRRNFTGIKLKKIEKET